MCIFHICMFASGISFGYLMHKFFPEEISMGYPNFHLYMIPSLSLVLPFLTKKCVVLGCCRSGAGPGAPVPPTMASLGLVYSSTSFTPKPAALALQAYKRLANIMMRLDSSECGVGCYKHTKIHITSAYKSVCLSNKGRDGWYQDKSNWMSPTW